MPKCCAAVPCDVYCTHPSPGFLSCGLQAGGCVWLLLELNRRHPLQAAGAAALADTVRTSHAKRKQEGASLSSFAMNCTFRLISERSAACLQVLASGSA